MTERIGIRKAGNAGLLAATSGGGVWDLLHTIALTTIAQQTFPARSFIIRKIMWYNNTGANATLIIGTQNATPGFTPLLPTIYTLNTFDDELTEDQLPAVEFIAVSAVALAAVRFNGNAYVLGSVAGIEVAIEVEEFGA